MDGGIEDIEASHASHIIPSMLLYSGLQSDERREAKDGSLIIRPPFLVFSPYETATFRERSSTERARVMMLSTLKPYSFSTRLPEAE